MRDFSKVERIVIKVGTNVLSAEGGGVDTSVMRVVARQVSELVRQKRQVILVSSGAIGMGSAALGLKRKVSEVAKQQALAAVGQGILMHQYQQAFKAYRQPVAQILLTNAIMSNRKYYVNLKHTMETLLRMQIVPIVNENDCVSIEEIGLAFGDNDTLSALVASKIDAGLLIILTDVAGLYDKNPRKCADAQLLPTVYEVTKEIEQMAGHAGSAFGVGGMKSKLQAIKIAAAGGCPVILGYGRQKNAITRMVAGEQIGTLFLPQRRLSNRKRWILNCQAKGKIIVDDGAAAALKNNRSLLLVGILDAKGDFKAGDVVDIGEVAKGVCDVSAAELAQLLAQKRQNSSATIGKRRAIVHANNMVMLG